MDTASIEEQGEYGDEMVDATKREIDDRSFDLENCPNVFNTAFKVAQTGCDFTDVAYLGPAGVVPPAAEVPSSSTTRSPVAPRVKRQTRRRRRRRWPLGAMSRNQVMGLRRWATAAQ
jgi:hypothetical protein